jgi:hypothetical protein
MISFTLRSLYVQGNNPLYTSYRRLGRPHSRDRQDCEEENLRHILEPQPRCAACSLVIILALHVKPLVFL